MKKGTLTLTFICLVSLATAQSHKAGVDLHNKATNAEEELKAAHALKKASDNNLQDGVTAYWASFVYSQAGRLVQDKMALYDTAFIYYERANKLLSSDAKNTAPLMALQALLQSLRMNVYFTQGMQDKGVEAAAAEQAAINKGLAADNNSALLHVLMGTKLIQQGMQAKPQPDLSKLLQGKIVLEYSKGLFNNMSTADSYDIQRWNEGWIDVWLTRIRR
jgi:hypothetical protein